MHLQWCPTAFYALWDQAASRNAQLQLTQQQGAAVKDDVIPSSELPLPAAGLAGRNLYLHLCCSRSQSHFLVQSQDGMPKGMLPFTRWEEHDDGQWDGAAPLQLPGLGWSKLAPQSRWPPPLGQNMPVCFDYIFLHGFGHLSTAQWCWLSVSYPQRSLRMSSHSITSLGCDSSFNSWVISIPAQKSPAQTAGNSAVSTRCCQGESDAVLRQQGQAHHCFSQDDGAAAAPLALQTHCPASPGVTGQGCLPSASQPQLWVFTIVKNCVLKNCYWLTYFS